MKQIEFIPKSKSFYKAFGGSFLKKSHAKTKRPVSEKMPIHLVIRSSQARGALSFRQGKNHRKIDRLVHQICRKRGVKLYEYANVGNHLHLLLKLHRHFLWTPFIRELTGKIVMEIVGYGKRDTPFFDQRPFTRIVNGWRRAYSIAKDYVIINQMEAAGVISRKVRAMDLVTNTG